MDPTSFYRMLSCLSASHLKHNAMKHRERQFSFEWRKWASTWPFKFLCHGGLKCLGEKTHTLQTFFWACSPFYRKVSKDLTNLCQGLKNCSGQDSGYLLHRHAQYWKIHGREPEIMILLCTQEELLKYKHPLTVSTAFNIAQSGVKRKIPLAKL